MGSLLLAAGHKDMRFSLPNSRIMVHQPSGGFQGQATDIMLHAQEILNLKKRLNEIYVKHTGQTYKAIEDALERDKFLTADMARDFGIVDKVIDKRSGRSGGRCTKGRPREARKSTGSRTCASSVNDRLTPADSAGKRSSPCPASGGKFRFRAGLAAWQSRNAWLISMNYPRANAANHGIVTGIGAGPISEFLIVGCQHGWLVSG